MTLKAEILSTESSKFLKQIIILKTLNSVVNILCFLFQVWNYIFYVFTVHVCLFLATKVPSLLGV